MSITLLQIGSMPAVTPDVGPRTGELSAASRGSASPGASPTSQNEPPVGWQPPQFSMAIRIDDRRRIYYEVINDHTGEVVFQIPPEVVRNIGEGINQFLETLHAERSVDVES